MELGVAPKRNELPAIHFFAQYIGLVLFVIPNIGVWYPWCTSLIYGIHDRQNAGLVSMIHNFYVQYPCYTIYLSGIHDTQCLQLVFIRHYRKQLHEYGKCTKLTVSILEFKAILYFTSIFKKNDNELLFLHSLSGSYPRWVPIILMYAVTNL